MRWLVAVLAVLAIALSVWRLEADRAGLQVVPLEVQGATPATLFLRHGGDPAPVVVIAHGFAGSRQLMEPYALTLARAGYVVASFDFRGHGRNPVPMSGDVTTVQGTTQLLMDETARVAEAALAHPQADGRLALLGHSMASDVIVRASMEEPQAQAVVAISMFSRAVTEDAPPNLLILAGEWEARLAEEALRAARLADPAAELGQTVAAGDTFRRAAVAPAVAAPGVAAPGGSRDGVVLPMHGLSGGVGATTVAVNLAWELATLDRKAPASVCLLDFDLQFGSCSTYLDLPRREAVYELWSNTQTMDRDAFLQALLPFNDRLRVLTAPADILPLDLVSPEEVGRIIDMARTNFDYVVIDMPTTIVQWTETVMAQAHVYFALIELDMRSAQNALRMIRAMKAEDLPLEKLRYVLNRAPSFTDLSGKARARRLAESLDIEIELWLPDGQKAVTQANDHGLPLCETVAKNALRKELAKLAKSLHDLNQAAEAAGI